MIFLTGCLLALAIGCQAGACESRSTPVQARQTPSSYASDAFCNSVLCIECVVEGDMARYVLRSTGEEELGWMAVGFGRFMGDSPMVVMWPSRGADGEYNSVTLSQRSAPYETMPKVDPAPPFKATLSVADTLVSGDQPQIAFTRPASPDGVQNIIWAFSRTPPESDSEDSPISIHHRYGRATLNLTRIFPVSDTPVAPESAEGSDSEQPGDDMVAGEEDDCPPESEADAALSEDMAEDREARHRGGFAAILHATLCIAGFLFVIPSGALVVRYAKATGNDVALELHRLVQLGVAGLFIAGGMFAYLFMGSNDSDAAHQWWGCGAIVLYGVSCAVGIWVGRIPASNRTRKHTLLLAGLGAWIVILAYYDTWLGLAAAGASSLWWWALLITVPPLYILGAVMVHRQTVQTGKGDYVALDTRPL
ncbi:hypothetical protein BC834DRAFT_93457 [Gloeopeniophorella convolvens]|nr:hypothetical protein BC834DRAFT_93457 [Gloeopeniophorella convolvens]